MYFNVKVVITSKEVRRVEKKMKKIGNIIPSNITSPSSWGKSILTVFVLLLVLGIGYWLYKKARGLVPMPTTAGEW